MRVRRAALIALAAAGLAGCGAAHHQTQTATKPSALAQAAATHEYPSPSPPPQRAAEPAATPVAAILGFATAYINWSSQTIAADMQSLAAHSIGQARSAMILAAAGSGEDYELQRGGIANHGVVEAVAPRPGHNDQYVVVTLESTTATKTTAYQGLRPAWHVALATVTEQAPGQFVLSGWQPEN